MYSSFSSDKCFPSFSTESPVPVWMKMKIVCQICHYIYFNRSLFSNRYICTYPISIDASTIQKSRIASIESVKWFLLKSNFRSVAMVDGKLLLYPKLFLTPLLFWFDSFYYDFFFFVHVSFWALWLEFYCIEYVIKTNSLMPNRHLLTHFRLRILLWSKVLEIFIRFCKFHRIVNVSLVFQ